MSHYGGMKMQKAEERITTRQEPRSGAVACCTPSAEGVPQPTCAAVRNDRTGERYANGKPSLPKCQCRHKDCVYRNRANGENAVGACDYIGITGHSRLLWHRQRGLSEEVKDCKLYQKREKKAEATTSSTASGPPLALSLTPEAAYPSLGKASEGRSGTFPEGKASGKKTESRGARTKRKGTDVAMVRELNRRGLNDKQIAQVMGRVSKTIFETRKANGITNTNYLGNRKSRVSDEEARRIYEELEGRT